MMHHVAEAIDHKSFYSLINSQSQLCAAGKLQNRKGPATKQNFSRKNNCFTIVSSWTSSQFREKKLHHQLVGLNSCLIKFAQVGQSPCCRYYTVGVGLCGQAVSATVMGLYEALHHFWNNLKILICRIKISNSILSRWGITNFVCHLSARWFDSRSHFRFDILNSAAPP